MSHSQKKILIDLERLRYPNTGLANVFKNLAKGLLNTPSSIDFFYFGTAKTIRQISPTLKVVPYKYWHRFYEPFNEQFDVIHSSNQGSLYFRKDYRHTQKILTLHDLNFLYEDISKHKFKKTLALVNANLKNTDYLVCISNFVKDDVLKNAFLLQLDKVKEIVVIHNGITFPEEKVYPLNGALAFLKARKYLLNIGVLFAKKNQKSLIEALPYIEEDLVLVSSENKGSYTTELKERITQLGLEQRVHLFSHISEEEKNALLQHCQALCQPSLAEGFGIPPIEAMAFGKSVFLSRYTSLPEIGGDEAFYFDSFDPQVMATTIKEGLAAYNQQEPLRSTRLKAWATQYNYCTMAQNYLDLYNRI